MCIQRLMTGLALLLIPILAFPAKLRVPGVYSTIQSAIDAAGDGDTILIADGTYSGAGNIGLHWDAAMKHLVIRSENGRDQCTIDCQQEDRAFQLNMGQDRRDVIEGLTITNGWIQGAGGAISIRSTSPVIRACLFLNNSANGGPDNSYTGAAGAIMISGASSPVIQDNIIQGNRASREGGGLLFVDGTSGIVVNNIIDSNQSSGDWGGGIAIMNLAEPLISNNLIVNNSCTGVNGGHGGGIHVGTGASLLVNNTIVGNRTGNINWKGYGGGISIGSFATPVIKNCIIRGNESTTGSRNIDFDLQKWLDISYSNVEEDLEHIFDLEPHTNMDAVPEFVDTAERNFQLAWNSPCINQGAPDTTGLGIPPQDLAGADRIFEGRVDIGAYEYSSPSVIHDKEGQGDFIIYPNPTPGPLVLICGSGEAPHNLRIRMTDLKGVILQEEVPVPSDRITVNLSSQPEGIYILHLLSDGRVVFWQKIIKR